MTLDRRALLRGATALPFLGVMSACGLELSRPGTDNDPSRRIAPEQLREGGVLRWAIEELPKNFNYLHADMTAYVDTVARALFPTVYLSDPHGSLTLNTAYFSSVELLPGEPQRVRYQLNPRAHWSDGTPLTWRDLWSQWQALRGINELYQIVSTSGYRDITSVIREDDDRHALVTFSRHYADWKGLFSYLYPASTTGDPDSFNKAWILGRGGLGRTPVTSGPFVIDFYDEDQGRMRLVRNPQWWGRIPRLDAIMFLNLATEAQIGALQNKEIDFTDLASSAPNLAIAQNTPGVDIRIGPSNMITNLTFNGSPHSLIGDVHVRRAVAMGIDRTKLVSTLLGAISLDPKPTYNLVFPQGTQGYEDHRADLPYDPVAARALLEQHGWVLHGSTRVKEGVPLQIRLVIPAQTATSANTAKILQQILRDIGVEIVIQAVASQDFLTKYVHAGNFDMTMFTWIHTPYPTEIGSIYGLYRNGDVPDIQQNSGQIGSEEINTLIAQMQQELHPEALLALGNQIDKKIAECVHSIPLYMRPANWAVRSDLRNFGPLGIGDTDLTAIGFDQ